jgi:hypothetical protein
MEFVTYLKVPLEIWLNKIWIYFAPALQKWTL